MSLGFPQAAGITGMLTAAGLDSAEVHAWFQEPRRELSGMSPATLIAVRELVPGAGRLLLELAQDEARRRREIGIDADETDDRELAEADEQAERRDIKRDEQREAEQDRGTRMGAFRYAGLIYHALRAGGRHPIRASGQAGRVLCRELTCEVAGHAWDWPLAVSIGITDRPVCKRCLIAAPRGGMEQRRA